MFKPDRQASVHGVLPAVRLGAVAERGWRVQERRLPERQGPPQRVVDALHLPQLR